MELVDFVLLLIRTLVGSFLFALVDDGMLVGVEQFEEDLFGCLGARCYTKALTLLLVALMLLVARALILLARCLLIS